LAFFMFRMNGMARCQDGKERQCLQNEWSGFLLQTSSERCILVSCDSMQKSGVAQSE